MTIANTKIKMTFLVITFSAQFSILPNKEDQKPNSQSIITSIFSYVTQKIHSKHHLFCPLCLLNPNRVYDQLAQAIINNNTKKITFLIKQREMHPNTILFDEKKLSLQTPLSLAARNGAVKSLKKLIQLGADVNKQIIFNATKYPTPLIESCAHKNQNPQNVVNIVKLLLSSGANPTLETDYYSGIHPLTWHEKELLRFSQEEKDEEKNETQTPTPRTALDLAEKNEYTETVSYLKKQLEALQKQ